MSALIDEHHDYEQVGRALDARLIRRLLPFARPDGLVFLWGLLLLFVISGLELVGPLLLRRAVDGPVAAALDVRSAAELASPLFGYALLFSGVLLAALFSRYAQFMLLNSAGQRVLHRIRQAVFARLQRLPIAYFDRHATGRLVSRVTTDVETLNELFTSGAVTLIGDLVKIVILLAVVFLIDPRLALLAVLSVPVLALASAFFRIRARQAYRETRSAIARVNSYLGETLAGVRVLKSFGREDRASENFALRNEQFLRTNLKTVFYFALFFPVVDAISLFIQGGVFWQGGIEILGGRLTVGQFLQFWLYLGFIFEPLRELAEKYNVLQSAMASAERVFAVIDEPAEPEDGEQAEPVSELRGGIEFDNVSFCYGDGEPVLKQISFRVEPGETVALVGATGSGKTTITALLWRFYEPTSGRILIDGRPVEAYRRRSLRGRMAYVPQDVFLFAGSVLDNLDLGNPEVTEERAVASARALGADRFIQRFEGGFAHDLTERGANLSAGERQIISFARALAADPAILVLDEATASIDPATERRIQAATFKLLAGRTSIVVAHRLSTIRRADRILVLHKGEIREQGTHDQLIQAGGLYSVLHRLQFGS